MTVWWTMLTATGCMKLSEKSPKASWERTLTSSSFILIMMEMARYTRSCLAVLAIHSFLWERIECSNNPSYGSSNRSRRMTWGVWFTVILPIPNLIPRTMLKFVMWNNWGMWLKDTWTSSTTWARNPWIWSCSGGLLLPVLCLTFSPWWGFVTLRLSLFCAQICHWACFQNLPYHQAAQKSCPVSGCWWLRKAIPDPACCSHGWLWALPGLHC